MHERLAQPVRDQVAIEQKFWSTDPNERPGSDTLDNLLNKAQDAAIFFDLVRQFDTEFRSAARIVELGGGQGWASCVIKRLFPQAHVTLTDAVEEALAGLGIWERVFACRLDDARSAPAQRLPLDDGSVDLLFCFAAAHHFVDHAAALRETKRLLSPSGRCLWLYEPTSPRWAHASAERRVNRKRPDVPEHVLIPSQIARLAAEAQLTCRVVYSTSIAHRGRLATLYYTLLGFAPVLTRVLPCTAHFVFAHA